MYIGVDIRCLMDPIRTGVGEYTYELLNALFSIDRENQYFLYYNSYADVSKHVRLWNKENVHYIETRWPNKVLSASLLLSHQPTLDKTISNQQSTISNIDVFFSPNLNFTSVSRHTKHVLTIHDLSFEIVPDCFSPKQRLWHRAVNPEKQCERADVILTPSENTKRDVVELYGIDEKKVVVLTPGISSRFMQHATCNMQHVKKKYKLPEKFIFFLGTIEPRKNVLGIVDAFQRSILITDHWSLIIAGPQGFWSSEILRAIEQTPEIRYIGYVPAEDKPALYAQAKAFVYPSLYEGFGFPVLEAMARGTPVITSNRSSLPEVALDAAYLVNPYNVSGIARAMEDVVADEKLRSLLVERGKKRAGEFEWEKTAKQFLEILNIGY